MKKQKSRFELLTEMPIDSIEYMTVGYNQIVIRTTTKTMSFRRER